jgi:hypothetical protein
MTEIDEIKSPFLLRNIKQRGIMSDLVTDLLIAERYLRRPELTDSVAMLMLRAAIKNHPLEVEIVSRELRAGRALADLEIEELKASLPPRDDSSTMGPPSTTAGLVELGENFSDTMSTSARPSASIS